MPIERPQYPVGPPPAPVDQVTNAMRQEWIAEIAEVPLALRDAVDDLTESQLDTKYCNWTIRQIVHHLADSHLHSYIRFKWTLTEDNPTIKAYDEGRWSDLREAQQGSIAPSLTLLDGLHQRWCQLLEGMLPAEFERTFFHPETANTVSLNVALSYYAWHGRHHTGQVLWLRENGQV